MENALELSMRTLLMSAGASHEAPNRIVFSFDGTREDVYFEPTAEETRNVARKAL